MTQLQLAQRIGANVRAITNLERGNHFPRFKTLLALSRELNVPLRDLLDQEPLIETGNDRRASVELLGRTLLHDLSEQFLTTAVEQLSALAKQDRLSAFGNRGAPLAGGDSKQQPELVPPLHR